ncbi:hypothetical protein Tel_10775 [Candidatus Tenderia electrophaga]|jgi:ElaB/YqjD/DUF883 family membrane-anchored ribosome-binding protein|uniref:DUF883 domain-containing protein n=1 Tax=Candidatus Tenderia electrophaga TaxID=1748243 RepID=A0A0S2TEL5_9GAMM|nr:hypothetical protein Tel_10775 [Candidatus Tenderia electrophaga]
MSKPASNDHATTDRISERAHESVDRVAEIAGKGEERIRHGAADAEARVRDAGQKAKKRSNEALQSISGLVRDKPLISLGLAFAAGTLLTALLRRRS